MSAARWQHASQICFELLFLWKYTKLPITQDPRWLVEKILEFLEFIMQVGLNLETMKFYFTKFLVTTKLFISWNILIEITIDLTSLNNITQTDIQF